MSDHQTELLKALTRRQFFQRCGTGMGSIALASLLKQEVQATLAAPIDMLAVKPPHFAPKARSVIYLHMAGAPSQLDLFDHKPKLHELDGKPVPADLIKGERFAFIKGVPKVLPSPYKFTRHGKNGTEFSELLPHLTSVADDIAVVRSVKTDQFNHAPAQLFVHTGHQLQGRPSMGAWVTYGLGAQNHDLPGFVVLTSGGPGPDGGSSLWGSGFLPTVYQGTQFRSQGDPVLFVSNPPGMSTEIRRQSLDAIRDLNQMGLGKAGDPEIMTRIAQYEMAYRMQTTVPELMDIAEEPATIHELYGTEPGKTSFANNCLLARRLVERGVRFVQLFDWGWDSHGTNPGDDLITQLPKKCRQIDRSATALIKDLKQRGLLGSTLVIWGGEFGRTCMNEERNGSKFLGRDHHPQCFSIWMAGGGIQGGITHGKTDELGYTVVEDMVHVHDLQATILHCLGMDHTQLTYRFQGRDFRLTDVHGNVVRKLLA